MGDLSEYQRRELRSPDAIANAIIFKRDYPGNEHLSFLIVEGDTDRRFFRAYAVDEARCNINVAYSKSTALQVQSILAQSSFSGFLVIVDADFDFLESKSSGSSSLLFTDTHDLETMIIKSPAFEKVLDEFGSAEKVSQFVQKKGKGVLAVLIECCKPVGYLRWVSLREGLSLKFEELDFGKFISKETLNIDVLKLIRLVQSRSYHTDKVKSQTQVITDNDIQQKMEQIYNNAHDSWHVCCGHDLVSVLSLGLCKALGSCNPSDVKIENLERSLRLAYERAHFQQTRLYASIQQWEQANEPFVILSKIADVTH